MYWRRSNNLYNILHPTCPHQRILIVLSRQVNEAHSVYPCLVTLLFSSTRSMVACTFLQRSPPFSLERAGIAQVVDKKIHLSCTVAGINRCSNRIVFACDLDDLHDYIIFNRINNCSLLLNCKVKYCKVVFGLTLDRALFPFHIS